MQIDIQSLETYSALARSGARSAADALSDLTEIETHVEVTNVSLLSPSSLAHEFVADGVSGVRIGLDGALAGEAVLTFDERARSTVVDALAPGEDDRLVESSIEEVGNIVAGGFLDGWADFLDAAIDITPPTYVEQVDPETIAGTLEPDDQVFVFRSRVEAVSEAVDFTICLLPERGPLTCALESHAGTGEGISLEKLQVFNEMTEAGARRAARNITSMTGMPTTVEVNRLNFVPVEDVPAEVGDQRYVGTVMEYHGKPSGYLAILFDRRSARSIVGALLSTEDDDTWEWDGMEQSAVEELGNIMTSGFVDGWANVLEASIDHSPPHFVADAGSSIMSPVVSEIARTQEYAFLLDSTIGIDDDGTFRCELLALPDEEELREALDGLLLERADETHVDPGEVF